MKWTGLRILQTCVELCNRSTDWKEFFSKQIRCSEPRIGRGVDSSLQAECENSSAESLVLWPWGWNYLHLIFFFFPTSNVLSTQMKCTPSLKWSPSEALEREDMNIECASCCDRKPVQWPQWGGGGGTRENFREMINQARSSIRNDLWSRCRWEESCRSLSWKVEL